LNNEQSGIFKIEEKSIDLHLDNNSMDSHDILQGINFGEKKPPSHSIVRPTNTLRFDEKLLQLDKKLAKFANQNNKATAPKKYINYQFNVNINVNNYGTDSGNNKQSDK
jgi:hypothetical protein